MNDFKKKMKEKIKQFSNDQYLAGYIQNEFHTYDGDADVFLNVGEKSELFDTWTVGFQKDLEDDIYQYIENKTEMLENDIKINLHIVGVPFTSHEQGTIKHVLKEHYAIELYKIQKKYIQHRNKIIALIGIAVLSFILYLTLYLATDFQFFMSVCSFVLSFSLWEAMDSYIYTLSEIKYKRESITQKILMDVDFGEKKDV